MVPVLVKRRTDYYELGEFSSRSPISRKLLQDKEPGVIFIVVKKCCPAFACKVTNFFLFHVQSSEKVFSDSKLNQSSAIYPDSQNMQYLSQK